MNDAGEPTRTLGKVAFVGSYIPRRCGIATFTADLLQSLTTEAPKTEWRAVAMNDLADGYDYPSQVQFEIDEAKLSDYRAAVDFLNIGQIDAVCLQHEYGLYGGNAGNYVLRLLQDLRMPVITVLHTVLKAPEPSQGEVIRKIADLSDRVVVMSGIAQRILRSVYGVPAQRIAVIPHGVPEVAFLDPSYHKDQFGILGKKVILTFGLLSPDKGIETMIDALPAVVRAHPDAVYVVAGVTHPHVIRRDGEAYRLSLQQRARRLGVDNHIIFYDRFMDTKTLIEFLAAADICVTPYQQREQIVSGVLSYALGAGKAIVSTPYRYAEEMLAEGRGALVPFRDPQALAGAISNLLDDDVARNLMRKRAYIYSRQMVWSEVAKRYLQLMREVRHERDIRPRTIFHAKTLQAETVDLPQPNFKHLRLLTDDVGILQHAHFSIADRSHGYCTDDNARALVVALLGETLLKGSEELSGLAHVTSIVLCQQERGTDAL